MVDLDFRFFPINHFYLNRRNIVRGLDDPEQYRSVGPNLRRDSKLLWLLF